jgi:hypothetical protein
MNFTKTTKFAVLYHHSVVFLLSFPSLWNPCCLCEYGILYLCLKMYGGKYTFWLLCIFNYLHISFLGTWEILGVAQNKLYVCSRHKNMFSTTLRSFESCEVECVNRDIKLLAFVHLRHNTVFYVVLTNVLNTLRGLQSYHFKYVLKCLCRLHTFRWKYASNYIAACIWKFNELSWNLILRNLTNIYWHFPILFEIGQW